MQFVLIAYDYKQEGLQKRLKVREKHVELAEIMRVNGQFVYGGNFRNEKDEMIGSIMFMEFPSRKELDEWLKVEPYVVDKVWDKIEIYPFGLYPKFLKEL
ncbi:MAG TPA: YciI family protein [Candidatus Saccharimonadales bacterium]|nr:YciI family protein [Candidatus Saccharimonadales bacterium]